MVDYLFIDSEELSNLNRYDAEFGLLELEDRLNGGLETRYIDPKVIFQPSEVVNVGKPRIICVQSPPKDRLYENIFAVYSYKAPEGANAFTRSDGSMQLTIGGSSKERNLFHSSGIDVGAVQYWKIPTEVEGISAMITFEDIHEKYMELPRH